MTQDIDELRADVCNSPVCIEHGTGTVGCPVPETRDEIDEHATYKVDPGATVSDVSPADVPENSSCPVCGSEPTDESVANHRLSDMGYLHDDVNLQCSNCDNDWTLGIPLGEFNGGNYLWCDSCDDSQYLVHRVDFKDERIHLKCPNCFHFENIEVDPDERGINLIGYPQITGATDNSEAYGYTDEPPQ